MLLKIPANQNSRTVIYQGKKCYHTEVFKEVLWEVHLVEEERVKHKEKLPHTQRAFKKILNLT